MAITDYASLKTAVEAWSHRSDLTNYLDDFIKLAEERMASSLRVREMETSATGTLSGITLALPADFAALRRFRIENSYHYIPIFIGSDGLKAKHDPAAGLPSYAAIVGSNIEFNRSPDSSYTYVLDYWRKPPAITSTSTTSDVLTAYPGIYLYACLVEVSWFTKNDADMQRYTAKLNELVESANKRGKGAAGPMQIVTA